MTIIHRARCAELITKASLVIAATLLFTEAISFAGDVDPISIGRKAQELTAIGILSAVIAILVFALVTLYRGKESQVMINNQILMKLVERTSAVIAEDKEIKRELISAISWCKTMHERLK